MSIENTNIPLYSYKQGQYLAYIFYYTKINGRAPSQADLQNYFQVTPPSVHQMILQLEKNNLIKREKKTARSLKVLLPREEIPKLD